MGFTYLLVIGLAVLTLRKGLRAPRFLERVPSGALAKIAYLSGLVASFAIELALLEQRQYERTALPDFGAAAFADLFAVISIVQTALLGALHLALSRESKAADVPLVLASGCVMLALALSFTSAWGDVLVYVANGMIRNPYDPAAIPFAEGFGRLNELLGTPILASPYGPLELGLSRLLDGTSATLAGRIHAFQIFGACALIATTLAVRARGAGIAVWALILCNPFLLRSYVADAHNDLHGIALLAIATLVSAPFAIALVVAASAIKLSLGAIGLVALARFRTLRTRLASAAFALAGCAAIVWLVGPQYVRAIGHVTAAWARPVDASTAALHAVAIAAIALAIAASLVRGRFNGGASWSTIALGQFPLDNYLAWGLPAAVAGDAIVVYLTTLPYAQYEVTNIIVATPFSLAIRTLVLCAIFFAIVVTSRDFLRLRFGNRLHEIAVARDSGGLLKYDLDVIAENLRDR